MSGYVVGWAFKVARDESLEPSERLKPNERYVLVAIADNADEQGLTWASMQTIIDKTGLGQSSVYRAVKRLRQLQLIGWGKAPDGSKCFALAVPPEIPNLRIDSQQDSHRGKDFSHRGKRSNKGTVKEPSEQQLLGNENSQIETISLIELLWEHYCQTMNRKSHLVLEDRTRRVLRDALKVADLDECKTCIDTCAGSDFHMKRGRHASRPGNRYNTVGDIFKPKATKGESQRDRIDFWLEKSKEGRGETDEWGWSKEDREGD